MNAAQKDIVDRHKSEIIKVLKTYSDTAILWLCNEGYLNALAKDQASINMTNLAKATLTLECLIVANKGWLGLMKFLEKCTNRGDLARSLEWELTSNLGCIPNHTDNLVTTQAESLHCVPCLPSKTRPFTSDWLTSLQKKLKLFYTTSFAKVRLFPNDPESAVDLEKIWVNLSIAANKEKEVHEDYLKALNVALESGLPIIIKGEPGIGKTTLVQKICYDWASDKLPQFDLVICGKMRGVPQADTLLDIALEWTRSRYPEINFDKLKFNLGNSEFNLLVILDGYDESICQCNDVERLLKSREPFRLPFTLIVTTRPYKLSEIACLRHLLTVKGFSPSQQKQFVENFCKLQKPQAISVQKKIESTASLSRLCKIPLFIYFICCLSQDESLDGSMTNLVFLLCESLISRCPTSTRTSAELTNWRKSEWIASVGALALYGLVDFGDGKLCFDNADLEKYSIDSNNLAYSVGFLNKEEIVAPTGKSRKVSVSFPHKVFQEFFAALALSNNSSTSWDLLPTDNHLVRDFFEMLEKENHMLLEMQQVLIFLAGMDGGRAILSAFLESHLYRLVPTEEDNCALWQQLIMECADQRQEEDLLGKSYNYGEIMPFYVQYLDYQSAVNMYNTCWNPADSAAIPCKEEGSSQLLLWDLDYCRCQAYNLNPLDTNNVVDHPRDHLVRLLYPRHIWFIGPEQHLPEIGNILKSWPLTTWPTLRVAVERSGEDANVAWPLFFINKLEIESTDSGRTELVPRALQSLLEAQPALRWLVFRGVENQRVTSLDCHCWPNTITELTFHRVSFDAALASQLCQALERLSIDILLIAKASMQLDAFDCLCRTPLFQALKLRSIRMDGLQSPEGCRTFAECFRQLTHVRYLELYDCGITDAVAECLRSSLLAMKELIELGLEFNPLTQAMKIKLRQCFLARNNV